MGLLYCPGWARRRRENNGSAGQGRTCGRRALLSMNHLFEMSQEDKGRGTRDWSLRTTWQGSSFPPSKGRKKQKRL